MDIQRVAKIPETNFCLLLPRCAPPIWGMFFVHLYCTPDVKPRPSFFTGMPATPGILKCLVRRRGIPFLTRAWFSPMGQMYGPHTCSQPSPSQKGSALESVVQSPPRPTFAFRACWEFREYLISILLHQYLFGHIHRNFGQF